MLGWVQGWLTDGFSDDLRQELDTLRVVVRHHTDDRNPGLTPALARFTLTTRKKFLPPPGHHGQLIISSFDSGLDGLGATHPSQPSLRLIASHGRTISD